MAPSLATQEAVNAAPARRSYFNSLRDKLFQLFCWFRRLPERGNILLSVLRPPFTPAVGLNRPGNAPLGAATDTIYISENGTSAADELAVDGNVYDTDRIMYPRNCLKQLQRATSEGVKIELKEQPSATKPTDGSPSGKGQTFSTHVSSWHFSDMARCPT